MFGGEAGINSPPTKNPLKKGLNPVKPLAAVRFEPIQTNRFQSKLVQIRNRRNS
jgi:hypothetical protein